MRPSDDEIMAVIRAKPGLIMCEIMRELGIEVNHPNKNSMNKAIRSLKAYKFIEPIDDIKPTRWKEHGADVSVSRLREKPLTYKCREHGLDYNLVHERIHHLGWTEEEALNTPVGVRRKSRGETLADKCRTHGADYERVKRRLAKGWSEEEAFSIPVGMRREKSLLSKSKEHGISHNIVWYRIHRLGWSEEEALTTPIGKKRKSEKKSLMDKCREHGMNYNTVYDRLKRGWSEEKALTTPIRRCKQ